MRCETCAHCRLDSPDWGYCGLTGDDVTPGFVCDQWAPLPTHTAAIGPVHSEVKQ